MKEVLNFILENWVWLSPILLEILLRLMPTDKDTSIISNAFKLLNKIIPNIRKPKVEDKAALQSDGTLKNVVAVNTKRHIIPIVLLLSVISFGASAQIWQNFKGIRLVNEAKPITQLQPVSASITWALDSVGGTKDLYAYDTAWFKLRQGGGGGSVDSVKSGNGITVDNTDAANPIINLGGFLTDDVLIDGAFNFEIGTQDTPLNEFNLQTDAGITFTGEALDIETSVRFDVTTDGQATINAIDDIGLSTVADFVFNASNMDGRTVNTATIRTTDLATYDTGLDIVPDSVSLTALTIDGEARITAQGIAGIDPGIRLNVQSGSGQSEMLMDAGTIQLNINGDVGTTGEALMSDGAGGLQWATPPSGGSPAGSDTEIQYNDGGAFGATPRLTVHPYPVSTQSTRGVRVFLGSFDNNNVLIDSALILTSSVMNLGAGQISKNGIYSHNPEHTNVEIVGATGLASTNSNEGQNVRLIGGNAYQTAGDGGGGDIILTTGIRRAAGIGRDGDLKIETNNGNGRLMINDGANETMGLATLAAGTITVNNTKIGTNTRVFLSVQTAGGTQGFLRIAARVAGTSFTITSTSATETSTVAWLLVEPN